MLSEITFVLCAALTLVGAVAAMTLRNVVHCALCAAGSFAGLAAFYLRLDAEFVGFAQLLIYVGAIAILIVFTVMLTRGGDIQPGMSGAAAFWWVGLLTAAMVLTCLVASITGSPSLRRVPAMAASAPAEKIGEALMNRCVMPLQTIGLLLTAALLGAVVIGLREPRGPDSESR